MFSTLKIIARAIADLFKGYDMRPYADRIVERTLRRLDEAKAAGKPLVLLIGENHPVPSHHVIQILVLKKLMESGRKIAVGMELSHNSLLEGYYGSLGRSRQVSEKNTALEEHIAACDPEYKLALKNTLGTSYFFSSNLSKKSLLKFLHDQKVSTSFNDAAVKSIAREDDSLDSFLDFSDRITQRAAAKAGYKTDEETGVVSLPGMHIRNALIVERALAHAQRSDAEIYIQNCGGMHVAGARAENETTTYPYEQSLSGLFKRAALPVLAAPLLTHDFSAGSIPKNHDLGPDEMVLNLNPFSPVFYYPQWDVQSAVHEWQHLNRLLHDSGLDPKKYRCNTHDQLSASDHVMQKYLEWDRQFMLPPANDSGAGSKPRRAPG